MVTMSVQKKYSAVFDTMVHTIGKRQLHKASEDVVLNSSSEVNS